MANSSIPPEQEEQLMRFLENTSLRATRSARVQVPLDGDSKSLIMESRHALEIAIELAVLRALNRLSRQYPVLSETKLLKPIAEAIVLARTQPIDLIEFFQSKPGLQVWAKFGINFDLSGTTSTTTDNERPYVASLLRVHTHHLDIRGELPEAHLSPLEGIASLIEIQPNGRAGFLLSHGDNVFYVMGRSGIVFAMRVSWSAIKKAWVIGYWPAEKVWLQRKGSQIICPGYATL